MAKAKKASGKPDPAGNDSVGVCSLPKVPVRELPAGLNPDRLRLIRINEKKWANGTVLHYYFFDRPDDGPRGAWVGSGSQQDVVRRAFQAWKDLGLGLEFREVADRQQAEIRIGFMAGDGSWSYVGRDVIDIARNPDERTMNFGWDLTTPYGWDMALHEIGHTLDFLHEHQNPNSGIVWNEQAVLDTFSRPPNNWDEATIRWNILRKLSPAEVSGSLWDPDSVMHYQLPAGVIEQPERYRNGLVPEPGLSAKDIKWARKFYPPLAEEMPALRPFESRPVDIGPGEQLNFRIEVPQSRKYTIQTFGVSDTVMVLFEERDGECRYIEGDDDSGSRRNSRIRARLFAGDRYCLRLRLYYSGDAGQTAVFMW